MKVVFDLKRALSLVVVVCFLTTNAMAMPVQELGPARMAYGAQRTELETFSNIPSLMGSVVETYSAKAKPGTLHAVPRTVIYIQDSHDSLEAQENIAMMVDHFVEKYGVKTVYEEGYEGLVPTDKLFGGIKDPALKEKISYFLMDKLRLGGAEFAHINRMLYSDWQLVGVDSKELHLANIRAYARASRQRANVSKDISLVRRELQGLVDKNFTKEMKKWLFLKDRYQSGRLPLMEYLQRTEVLRETAKGQRRTGVLSVPRSPFPQIENLLSDDEKKIKRVDARMLLEEIKRLEDGLVEKGLPLARDRKTYGYYQGILLLERLNDIELSHEEFAAVKESLEGLKTKNIAQFIAQESGHPVVLFRSWESLITDAINFYELAKKRDEALEKFLGDSGEDIGRRKDGSSEDAISGSYPLKNNVSVLVFGGFHKEAIKRILKEKGINYVILAPFAGAPSKRHQGYYRRLMQGEHYEFESSVSPAETDSPDSFYPTDDRSAEGGRESACPQRITTLAEAPAIISLLAEAGAPLRLRDRKDFIFQMDNTLAQKSPSFFRRSEARERIFLPTGVSFSKLKSISPAEKKIFYKKGRLSVKKVSAWVISNTSILEIDESFKDVLGGSLIDKVATQASAEPEKTFYVMDWGAGNLTAAKGLLEELRAREVFNVHVIATGDTFSSLIMDVLEKEPQITLIVAPFEVMGEALSRALPEGAKIAAAYSLSAFHFLFDSGWSQKDAVKHFAVLGSRMSPEGFFAFNVETFSRIARFHDFLSEQARQALQGIWTYKKEKVVRNSLLSTPEEPLPDSLRVVFGPSPGHNQPSKEPLEKVESEQWLRKLLPPERWESGKFRPRTSAYPYALAGVASKAWQEASAPMGDELMIQGRSVMEAWQREYMGEFAKVVTRRGGRILELGFGMGLSASAIQKHDIREHVIIEPNKEVFARLQEFAKTAPHKVTPILGMWQDVIRDKNLFAEGSFDGIFFDASPFDERELHFRQFDFSEHAQRLLKPGGIYTYCNLSSLGRVKDFYDNWGDLFRETQLPHLQKTGFKDISFTVVEVNPSPGHPKYQHRQAMIPAAIKEGPSARTPRSEVRDDAVLGSKEKVGILLVNDRRLKEAKAERWLLGKLRAAGLDPVRYSARTAPKWAQFSHQEFRPEEVKDKELLRILTEAGYVQEGRYKKRLRWSFSRLEELKLENLPLNEAQKAAAQKLFLACCAKEYVQSILASLEGAVRTVALVGGQYDICLKAIFEYLVENQEPAAAKPLRVLIYEPAIYLGFGIKRMVRADYLYVLRQHIVPQKIYVDGRERRDLSSAEPARMVVEIYTNPKALEKYLQHAPSKADEINPAAPETIRSEVRQTVREAVENMKGRFAVVTESTDVENFTDAQLQEFEVMAHLQPNVKLVFTDDERKILSAGKRERLQRLQAELGVNRIVITKGATEDLLFNKGEKVIRIAKGNGKRGAGNANRKIFQFKYVAEETGLVPVALLYADQHEKPSEKGMMDLSMVGDALRVAIREFQNSVVFARAA